MSAVVGWACSEDHRWDASLSNVINRGTWCPQCSLKTRRRPNQEDNLARAAVLAARRGGKCLETANFSIKAKARWECSEGHQWETPFYVVVRGSWCRRCAGQGLREARLGDNLAAAREIAARRGGECLATANFSTTERVPWRCAQGHSWVANIANMLHLGCWCPSCPLKSETFCRQFLEALFPGYPFPKTRAPAWLPCGVGGRKLELDMYNEDLRLAVEFNGFLHECPVGAYGGLPHLAKIQHHDALKAEACQAEGVCLITIPGSEVGECNGRTADRAKIAGFIWDAIVDLGFPPGTHLDHMPTIASHW